MVQKRSPYKSSPSQLEPKIKNHAKSERRLSSHHHQDDIRNKGGSDLRKKMKRSLSNKLSDLASLDSSLNSQQLQATKSSPHKNPSTLKKKSSYMKPTSSSDAKKEHLQVRLRSSNTVDKNPSHLQRPSPSFGLRPTKVLSIKSSLKPVRPLMKMSSGTPLLPKIVASRATCSSTMKDSTFPKTLELSPGATESQGTSVMKVCPYTFCSLNGHRHEPLPPLKCFLSARRRLLKTQKSMKLRKDSEKGRGEMDIMMGQMVFCGDPHPPVSATSPLIEEVGNNFFVEIYAKPQAEIIPEHVDDVECSNQEVGHVGNPKDKSEIPLVGDNKKSLRTETQEDDRLDTTRSSDQPYSETSLEDNWDQYSYASISDMEVPTNFLKRIECDYEVEVEPQDTNQPPSSTQDYVEWSFGCYMLSDSLGKNSESLKENQPDEKAFEATGMDWEEEKTPCPLFITGYSEIHDYGTDPSLTFLPGNEDAGGELSLEEASVDTVADLEPNDEGKNLEDDCPMEVFSVTKGPIQNPLTDSPDQIRKAVESSERHEQQSVLNNTEIKEDNSDENMEKSEDDQCKEYCETETNASKFSNNDDTGKRHATRIEGHTRSSADETYPAANIKCSEDGPTIINAASNTKKLLPETSSNLKTWTKNQRYRGCEDLEELKPFNPRAPCFLPVEPDPEADKVDLRHQMMDERKSAEEWMIDYALQQAITNLAPARKRKVALLIEAFETVMPLPTCEKHLRHGTVGFGHVRHIQACS